jgi:predicted transcriptional regulator
MEKVAAFLRNQSVQVILDSTSKRSLIEADANTTLEDALDMMAQEDIISLPIYEMDQVKKYLSVISMFDILAFIAFQPALENKQIEDQELTIEHSGFLQHPIRELIALSPESHHLHAVASTASLADVITVLAGKAHRVLVLPTSPDSAVQILTQSDVTKYMKANLVHVPELASYLSETTAKEFLAGIQRKMNTAMGAPLIHVSHDKNPLTITIHKTALVGFKKMFVHKVTAIGIVDDRGALVGVLSASDLRGLKRHQLGSLNKPAMTFLIETQQDRKEPFTCSEDCSLVQCLEKLIWTRVHRIFVVNKDDMPVGVISYSDMLGVFERPLVTGGRM